MCEVSASIKTHAENGVTGLKQGLEHALVGLGARVGLHVGKAAGEEQAGLERERRMSAQPEASFLTIIYTMATQAMIEAMDTELGRLLDQMDPVVRARTVVIEFKDFATAKACYDSVAYQQAKALRDPVSTGDMEIIEGYGD